MKTYDLIFNNRSSVKFMPAGSIEHFQSISMAKASDIVSVEVIANNGEKIALRYESKMSDTLVKISKNKFATIEEWIEKNYRKVG